MRPEQLARDQNGLVARWQLIHRGMTPAAIDWWASDLARPFPGVYLTGCGSLTPHQRWIAATLTAPGTALGATSAAARWALVDDPTDHVSVVRVGDQGIIRCHGLVIRHSATLSGNLVTTDGVRTTSAERTIIDVWPLLRRRPAERMVREALRTEVTTSTRLLRAIGLHRGRRGLVSLRAFVQRYSHLPFHRCRSAAETFALVVLEDAGIEIPLVNVNVHGMEADLMWVGERHIIEIDGPQYHRLSEDDARRTAVWEAAGFRVDRLPSPRLFADPASLVRLARQHRRRT